MRLKHEELKKIINGFKKTFHDELRHNNCLIVECQIVDTGKLYFMDTYKKTAFLKKYGFITKKYKQNELIITGINKRIFKKYEHLLTASELGLL